MAQEAQGVVKNVHDQPPGVFAGDGLDDFDSGNPDFGTCPDAVSDCDPTPPKPMGYEANRDALPAGVKKMPDGYEVWLS